MQFCRTISLDNNNSVKLTSSREDNSTTNDSMVMKIAHAQLHIYTNIMYKFQSSTCKTVGEKLRAKLCPRTDRQPWWFQYTPSTSIEGCINIVRKGEIACNKQFLLFSQCFLPYVFYYITDRISHVRMICRLQMLWIWLSPKFCHLAKVTAASQYMSLVMREISKNVAPPGWLSGEHVGLMSWWLWVRSLVEATFLSGVFPPLTSAEACEKSSQWLLKRKVVLVLVWESQETQWYDLSVKVALNPNTTNQI